MVRFVRNFFSCSHMLKPGQVQGEIPPSRDVYRRALAISWPSALEAVLVSLMSIIDSIMVSTIGVEAIAAIGITGQPRMILLAMISSLNVGVTAVVARRRGQDDYTGANKCLRQVVQISCVLSLLLSVAGFFFARPIITLAGAGADILDDAVLYFQITMIGFFFSSVGLTLTAAQRGVGNTRISLVTNIAANIVNMIFNYLLINGIWIFPKWGIAGAAAATSLGNVVGFVIAIASLMKQGYFLSLRDKIPWRMDWETISSVVKVASGAMVEQVFMRIGFFTYVRTVASLGTIAFGTHQICMNILNLSFSFGDGLGVGASALVGQSLGQKRRDMAMIYGKVAQRIAVLISCVICLFFVTCRYFLVGLFTDDPGIIATGGDIMLIMAATCFLQTSQVVISGCLRGAGDTRYVALTSLVCITFIRPFTTWLFAFPVGWGLYGAWVSLFLDQASRFFMNFGRFARGKWSKIEL